jgi:hypothetical protein
VSFLPKLSSTLSVDVPQTPLAGCLNRTVALGNTSDSGDLSRAFIIDADSRVFGSGAAVAIRYDRNNEVLECA